MNFNIQDSGQEAPFCLTPPRAIFGIYYISEKQSVYIWRMDNKSRAVNHEQSSTFLSSSTMIPHKTNLHKTSIFYLSYHLLVKIANLKMNKKNCKSWAWAQLVEQSLPTPEIRGLNPNIGKTLSSNCTFKKEKTKRKKKRPWMAHLKKGIASYIQQPFGSQNLCFHRESNPWHYDCKIFVRKQPFEMRYIWQT